MGLHHADAMDNGRFGLTFSLLSVISCISPIFGAKTQSIRSNFHEQHITTSSYLPCGYIIELENVFKIYHAGDTGVFADMAFIGDFYQPDLALLPIGGHFTMDPVHAGYAVRTYFKKVKKVIPMHYGTFGLLKGTPEEFKKEVAGFLGEVIVMQPGDKKSF